jgi:ribonuclease P protein component
LTDQAIQNVKLGVVASKKSIGSAVKRNKSKRILRTAARLLMKEDQGLKGKMVLVAREKLLAAEPEEVVSELRKCLKKVLSS